MRNMPYAGKTVRVAVRTKKCTYTLKHIEKKTIILKGELVCLNKK